MREDNGDFVPSLRDKHCFFARLSNGRCYCVCHHNRGSNGDCTGNTNNILSGPKEETVTCGFIDGTNVEVDAKGYRVKSTEYVPDINRDCSWGKSSTKPSPNAAHLTQQYVARKVHP